MADTLLKQVNYSLGGLIEFIELGQIGLPDLQRPFVWPNAKVRDLFDSMYRGYPVGYLLFWENGLAPGEHKVIGTDNKQLVPDLLVVDGQQRLTSLYAVTKGVPVLRKNYKAERIEIAFNPLQERFEVADAAVRKNPAFIPNISVVWGTDFFHLVDGYFDRLAQAREITEEERHEIKKAIIQLHGLQSYPFTALVLSATSDEEQVSEVFVRIMGPPPPASTLERLHQQV